MCWIAKAAVKKKWSSGLQEEGIADRSQWWCAKRLCMVGLHSPEVMVQSDPDFSDPDFSDPDFSNPNFGDPSQSGSRF
jgi:hypothetical protein